MGRETATVRVELLGPVQVVRGGVVSLVTSHQQALALALLALRPGRLLTADELIARIWRRGAPPTVAAALRVQVGKVRQLVSIDDLDALPKMRGGYRLDPRIVRTDLQDFDEIVARLGRADHARATGDAGEDPLAMPIRAEALAARDPAGLARRLQDVEAALALLRGRPFGEIVEDEELRIEAERIDQVREGLEEELVDVRLALGQHVQVAAEAAALVALAPLRERRTRQLMLALYRSGRQADALSAYRRLRDVLDDELGIAPAPRSRALELAILNQESRLAPPQSSTGAAPANLVEPPGSAEPSTPSTEHVQVQQRLDGLSDEARRLVRLVAVLDDASRPSVVAAAFGHDPEHLSAAQTAARGAGFLVATHGVANLALSGPEVRESVLHGLPPAERAELHAAAGRALAAYAAGDPSVLVTAAWHLALAARAGAALDATDELVVLRAVGTCLATDQPEAADRLAAEVLASEAPASPARVDLRTARVHALTMIGRAERATEEWTQAVAAAREVGDPERLALAVLSRDWAIHSAQSAEGGADLLREALARLGPRASAVRLRVLSALLLELSTFRRATDEIVELTHEVEALAHSLEDPESRCAALHVRHVMLRPTADLAARRVIGEQFTRVAEATGDPWWQARAAVARLTDLFAGGEYAAVPATAARLKESALASRSARLTWHHALVQSSLSRELGDFTDASRWADEAMMQGAAGRVPDTLGAAVLGRVLLAIQRADLVPFLPQVIHFRSMQPENPIALACLSLGLAQSGDLAAARAPFDGAVSMLQTTLTEIGPLSLAILTHAALTLEATEAAAPLRDLLAPLEGQYVVFGQVTATLGPIERYLGLLDWLGGDHSGALVQLASAQAMAASAGAVPWVVACAGDRARVLRSAASAVAEPSLAAEYAAQAASLAAEFGPAATELDLKPSLLAFGLADPK